MAITNGRIGGRKAGAAWQIVQRVPQIPTGLTVTDAYLQVGTARNVGVSDPTVLFSRHITTSAAAEGQILDIGSAGTAVLNFLLPSATTQLFVPDTEYQFDVMIVLSNGANDYPWSGTLTADAPLITPPVVP